MKIPRNKTIVASITFVLALTIAISLIAIPIATAQLDTPKQMFPYIDAVPNPVGVGQETLLFLFVTDQADRPQDGWPGLTVTITKPDGNVETLGPIRTDTTGGTGRIYVPDQVGTYTLVLNFPEQRAIADVRDFEEGQLLAAATSPPLELVVQAEPIEFYPPFPLPQEYWTRPVDAQIREWWEVTGNWPGMIDYDRLAPYNDGPETPHVLWTKPLSMGGHIGGEYGALSYVHGDAYEGQWEGRCVLSGRLYYNEINTRSRGTASATGQHVVCVDLHTGEELWRKQLIDPIDGEVQSLAFGQMFHWSSFNHHGAYPYLWCTSRSTWHAYDAFTGEWAYTLTDVPDGDNVWGKNGEILRYNVEMDDRETVGWMTLWNATKAVNPQTEYASIDGSWGRKFGNDRIINASETGIQWNVSVPTGLPGEVKLVLSRDKIIGSTVDRGWFPDFAHSIWAISVAPGQEGTLLYHEKWTPPNSDIQHDIRPQVDNPAYYEDGVLVMGAKDAMQYYGFDIDTGKLIWGPTTTGILPPLASMTMLYANMAWGQASIAYGKLFAAGMSGTVAAWDVKTGQHLWTYEAEDPYSEILWNNNWPSLMMVITDGKLYLNHALHSHIDPRARGAPAICLDAETGEEIWRVNGLCRTTRWGGQMLMADSIIATYDTYTNLIMAMGKGPTKTTVSAPETAQPLGTPVLIKGMVTDVSPGTNDPGLKMRFPNGIGAVSDEDQGDWMLYVYKQFPFPMDATGVEVVISIVDPNNNYKEIGRTTSDASGMYKLSFTPEVEGEYTVITTFTGSKAYWGSQGQTALLVSKAPAPSGPIEPEPTEAPLITTEIAIIIAVVVVAAIGIAAYWLYRRRQ
jgi:outer membrane protein assembly factor BamB